MAPELRLSVGLDLAFFRQQMRKAVNIAQSEFTAQLQVKFNRQILNNELRNLDRAIKRKKFNVELNIVGGLTNKQFDQIQARLDALAKRDAVEIPVSIRAAANQDEINKTVAQLNRRIKGSRVLSQTNGKIKIGTTIRPAITVKDVTAFKQEVQSRLSGISVKVKAELAGDGPAASQAQTPQASTTRTGTFRQRLTALGKESKENLQALYRAAGEAGILAFDEAIVDNKGKMISALNQAGEDSVQGLLNGLKSKERSVGDAAKKLGKKLIASIKAELGIASPSKEFMEIGKDAGEGLEIGLIGYLQLIKNRATKEMRGIVAAVRFEAMKLGDINFGARAGVGPSSIAGRAGILPPAGMGRIDLNARQIPTRMPSVASSTGATGAMSMLPSSTIETYRMGGAQLALPSTEMRAAAAAAKSQERVAEAGRELTRSLREAAAAIPRRPGLGIRHMGTGTAGYTSPIGPLPTGSAEPWSPGSRGMYGGGGFEPFMNARLLTERVAIQGTQAFRAPAIGEQFKKVNEAFKGTQPIANRLREAAIAFSKDAPIVAQYLNSFRARKINISDLPGAGESPGQYIRRIQEAFRQGPFGAGTVPAGGGGGFAFGQGPQVPGYPVQRALPPAGMTTAAGGPNYPFDRVTGGGGGGGGGRGGAIVPYAPRTELPPGYLTGGKIQQALKGADQYLKQSRVPLTGAIQELGGEFGNAVKQVLLFGTAYKALAFIIDLPNQALSAATALQTFNNQLLAVTGSAGAANSAFSFIDGLAERFNVPLNSAREGFVRLYASMEPAGFAPEQIEGLFTGISKAAATFGLSADQVDRVTYAFSQMASKGQAMSEELKGQLGDVLPGSLALFARAAQMSIPEFTKALEDGAFKGEAFQALLRNVAKLMNTEFAQGAAGAAETLQGRMNDLGNSVQKMYESFEPLVGLASAEIFPQLTSIISDTTEAVQAFVAGVQGADNPAATLSSRGLQIYNAFLQVAEIGKSLLGIIETLGPTFGIFGKAVLIVVEALARLMNTNVGSWLAKLAVQVALVTAALQLMAKAGIVAAIRGLIMLVTNTTGAIVTLKTLITTSVAAKIALGGLVLGTVLVFFEAMTSKVDQANAKLRDTAKFARDLSNELDAMASAGDVTSATAKYTAAEQKISSLEQSIQILEEAGGLGGRQTTQAEFERLQRSGLASGLSLRSDLRTGKQFLTGAPGQIEANLQAAREGLNKAAIESGKAKDAMKSAIQVRKGLETQNQALETVDITGEDEKGKTKKQSLESYYNLEDSLAKAQTEAEIDRIKQELDARIDAINAEYDIREARANSFHKEAIRLGRELENIELNRIKDIANARLEVVRSRGMVKREGAMPTQNAVGLTLGTVIDDLYGGPVLNGQGGPTQLEVEQYEAKKDSLPSGPRKIPSSEKRQAISDQAVQLAIDKETLTTQIANEKALRDRLKALLDFQQAVTPAEELNLQNDLLSKRNKLLSQGLTDADIETQLEMFEASEKVRYANEEIVRVLERYGASQEDIKDLTNLNTEALKAYNVELERQGKLQKEQAFGNAVRELENRISLARAFTPGQEIREGYRQQGFKGEQVEQLAQLEELAIKAEEIKAVYQNVAQTIGDAFGQAFQDVVNGSKGMQEALSNMLQSIGESFVAMAAEIIAKQVAMITLQAILKALGGPSFGGGGSGGGGGLPFSGGEVSNFNTTGFGNLTPQAFPVIGSANGNVLKGGFQAFANGGVVKGPTLGLVGEGKYNEAVVPLPDGRSIPVQFGGRTARDLMGKNAPGMPSSPVLNMKFETTNIGGVEYVSREQLELAMAQTRREAARDGANRGSQLTLNKLQNSPATRRQIGIR